MAPGLQGPGTLVYQAAHNQIRWEGGGHTVVSRAHARAYRAYHMDFAADQVGWRQDAHPTTLYEWGGHLGSFLLVSTFLMVMAGRQDRHHPEH